MINSMSVDTLLFTVLTPYELVSVATHQAQKGAFLLNSQLKRCNLSLITLESLTAGAISKTLIDVPGFGSYLYGGVVVYATDLKRWILGVKTPDVYSEQTAKEMAEGGLRTSR